jgi:hypothetical protein
MKFSFSIGRRTLTASLDPQATITPLTAAVDFSYSMFSHFKLVENISIKLLENGADCFAFSSDAMQLDPSTTLANFPRKDPYYACGTQYATAFRAMLRDSNLQPNSNVIFFTDGMPEDRDNAAVAAVEVHNVLQEGGGKVQFYYLGSPNQANKDFMRKLSFPPNTEPIVFSSAELEKILYGAMRDNVPVVKHGSDVSTGIWRVTSDELKDEEVVELCTCQTPEVALACTAAMLNYMHHHKLGLSHQDSKRLNHDVLQKFQAQPGVPDLMHKVRDLAASSGMEHTSSSAMELLLMKANVVTGSVPDRALIDAAVMALVRNPQAEYAKMSRAERDRIKASQKEQARYRGLAKLLGPSVDAAAEVAVKYMQDEVLCYRIRTSDELSPAVIANPESLHVEFSDEVCKFELGSTSLLPVACDSADYVKTLTFNLFKGRILTKKAHLCLLNGLYQNPAPTMAVIKALKLLPEFECFAQKPRVFQFDPEAVSARNFVFLPYFTPIANVPDAMVQSITAVLHQACTPLGLDESRLVPTSAVNIGALIAALGEDFCNVAALAAKTFQTLKFDAKVHDTRALAANILSSYTVSAPPPEGVTPALPTREQFLATLHTMASVLLSGLEGSSPERLVDLFICEAGLRLAVAHSIGATKTSGTLHSCDAIAVGPGFLTFLTFKPSESTAKNMLVNLVLQQLGGPLDRLPKLEHHPLVYFRLTQGQVPIIERIVDLVDWQKYQPTAAWPTHALDYAAKLPMKNKDSALAMANLRRTFDASLLEAEDVAHVLLNADTCIPTGIRPGLNVLRHIPFDAKSMRNALFLLDDPATGLQLLQTAEGCALSKDQVRVALSLKDLGVDVSQFKNQLTDSPLNQRILNCWMHQTRVGLNPQAIVSWFTRRHSSFHHDGMTPKEFYDARMRAFQHGPPKAIQRTEVLGMWLRAAGVAC